MKKGFTLIELLAVIIILAIILAIAIPSISKVMDEIKENALIQDEQMVAKATKNYIGINESTLPTNIGDSIEVTLSTLESNNYITEMKNPYDKDITCNGYVMITKVDTNKYEYTPHLNCTNDIGNKTDDKLIAHFKFDDFQEPTVNLLSSDARTISNNNSWPCYDGTATPYHVWGTRIERQVIEKGYSDINNSLRVYNTCGQSGSYGVVKWSAITGYGDNVKFTWSALIRGRENSVGDTVNFHRYSANSTNGDQYSNKFVTLTNEWQKASNTWSNRQGDSTNVYILDSSSKLDLEFTQPQVEAKGYSTPFVDGTREGLIKDYSGNGNQTALQLSTTPKWIQAGKDNGGAYEFDGANTFIQLPASLSTALNNSNFTISAWIKSYGMASGMNLAGIINLGYGLSLSVTSSGNLGGRMDDGSNLTLYATSGSNLHDNVFHFVTMTYDGTDMKLYVDGMRQLKVTRAWNNRYSNAGAIGYEANVSSTSKFYGIIDDVSIYKRTLSDEEIDYLYIMGVYKKK